MKRLTFVATALACILIACKNNKPATGANGVTYTSPTDYNDYIIKRQATLMDRIVEFSTAAKTDLDSAERALDKCVKETGTMIADIKGMPPYKGDSSFRDASANLFVFYKRTFDGKYRDILHLQKEQDGTSVEIADRIDALVTDIEDEEKKYDIEFQSAQKSFAKKNNMRLTDNPAQKKFDKEIKDLE